MDNWRETLLAQYANSPTIVALIESFNDCIDTSRDLDQFFDTIWNVETAGDYGLDFWGKVVDIPRQLRVTQESQYLGFNEAYREATSETGVQPFNQAPFYDGQGTGGIYTLETEAYRRLIMVKATSNITDCTPLPTNRSLQYIWGNKGRAYVVDYGDMVIRYVFEFMPRLVDIAIVTQTNAIARPAGVKLASLIVLERPDDMSLADAGIYPFDETKITDNGGSVYAIQ